MALLLWKRNNGPQGGSFIRLFFSIFFQLAYKPSGFSAGFVNSLEKPAPDGAGFLLGWHKDKSRGTDPA
ncbi:hypothetical protein, partial [Planifilum fimeticola]